MSQAPLNTLTKNHKHKKHQEDKEAAPMPGLGGMHKNQSLISQKTNQKIIVDKDIGQTMEGIHGSVEAALQFAKGNTTIKIASDRYKEQLLITKPNLVLEPKEKGGEVTFQPD